MGEGVGKVMGEVMPPLFYEDPLATLYCGDAREVLASLPAESVQCCITSPPYLGQRDYKIPPVVWGGQAEGCEHEWGETTQTVAFQNNLGNNGSFERSGVIRETTTITSGFCVKCGAWLGSLGLEPTPELYVQHIVEVFRAVKRVLRPDSTCWLNLGDSFSVGSNVLNELQGLIKSPLILIGGRPTISITSKRSDISENHDRLPEGKLVSLLGVQRITVKEGDDYLGQVLYLLNTKGYARISPAIRFMMTDSSHLQIFLAKDEDISIVISELNTNMHPELRILGAGSAGSSKQADCSLTIKEATEPIAEVIGNSKAIRDAIMGDSFSEGCLNINFVDQTIPLGDTSSSAISHCSDLKITKASQEQVSFLICKSRVNLTFRSVAHLYSSNQHSSFIHYQELYHKANEKANEKQAKQELGIPEMVKRALMKDGWICRSTIIWAKPNPMPESVAGSRWERHRIKISGRRKITQPAQIALGGGRRNIPNNRPSTIDESEWEDCPGCPVCLPNDGLVLRKGSWRPTTSHEYVFLLTKTSDYYADGEAVREIAMRAGDIPQGLDYGNGQFGVKPSWGLGPVPAGRNKRTVWEITTQPYSGAHFATFPEKLVEPCLLAGTSERGACPKCGKAWVRVIEKVGSPPLDYYSRNPGAFGGRGGLNPGGQSGMGGGSKVQEWLDEHPTQTLGWRPACDCGEVEAVPCLVLDCFAGSGTVGVVARQWGRKAILIELSKKYSALAVKRLTGTQPALERG